MLSRQGQRPQTPFAYASVHPALRGSFASLHYSTRLPYPDLPVTSAMMQSSDSLSVLSLISLTQFAQFEAQLSVKSIESMVLHYGAASVRGMHKPLPVPVQTPEHKEAQPTGLKHWMGTLKLRAKTLLGRKAPEKENLPPSYDCKLQQATRPPLTSLFASSLSSINNPFEEHNEGFSKIWRDSEGVRYLCVEQVEPSLQQRDAFWQLRIEAMRYGKVIPIPVKNIMKRCRSKNVDLYLTRWPCMSTIYALSTSAAKAAIAVIRISGPQARLALAALTPKRVKPRQAHLVKLRHQGQLLDEALAFYMPGPASFTGEDSVELHVHGGKAVIRSVLAALSSHKGLRYAEPGEFSKRAFRAGKLDLTQAEALADLIHAETEQQRRAAVSQAAGALAKRYDGWREQLIQGRAMLEAVIDFGEDNEIDSTVVEQVQQRVRQLQEAIRNHLEAGVRGERLKHGITVALFGPPNAGKSSLLNLLCRREVSIVSDEAGTTRDVVETMLDIGGYPVILCDTAGLRDAQGFVEQQGVRLANMRVEEADLRLCVVPAGEAMDPLTQALVTPETMLVVNKVDLRSDARQGHHLSCTTHAGVDAFLAALTGRLQALTSDEHGQGLALGTTARHREQCERCLEHLDIFLRYDTHGFDFVLAAEELRYAGDCLGRVLGRIDVEELLSVIFRDFCIGK